MLSAQPQPHRRLDELVMEALASFHATAEPPAAEYDIEMIVLRDDDGDAVEVAATTQFIKFSAPYERVEVDFEPSPRPAKRRRPTTFVHTVRARPTDRMDAQPDPDTAPPTRDSLDSIWYDRSEDSLSHMLEADHDRRRQSWIWLAIALAVATITTLALA